MKKTQTGFTIIEMMIVITILFILCSISIPFFFTTTLDEKLKGELEKIGIIMLYARQQAMATNHEQQITFDPSTNTYSFTQNNKSTRYTLTPPFRFGFMPGSFGPPANPTAPIEQASTFPQQKNCHVVKFFPTGSASPGTLYLTDQKESIMGALTCNVAQVSYIRTYIYKNRTWKIITEGHIKK